MCPSLCAYLQGVTNFDQCVKAGGLGFTRGRPSEVTYLAAELTIDGHFRAHIITQVPYQIPLWVLLIQEPSKHLNVVPVPRLTARLHTRGTHSWRQGNKGTQRVRTTCSMSPLFSITATTLMAMDSFHSIGIMQAKSLTFLP